MSWLEPYTSLWVAFGTLVTIGGIGIISALYPTINGGLIALGCFAVSGTPMIYGEMKRYMQSQADHRAAIGLAAL